MRSILFWPRHCPAFLEVRRAVRALPGAPLVGLSGGADSLALVAACLAEGRDTLAMVVDHGLQPGSEKVARRAVEVARELGARAEVIPARVAPGNLEAEARKARYAALCAAAHWSGRDLWVAHTSNDNAETLLLAALRGYPAGMPVVGKMNGVRLLRPLLDLSREITEQACEELGLEPWQDPMNSDDAFLRVALRAEVIPRLGKVARTDAARQLGRAAAHIAQDAELLEELAAGELVGVEKHGTLDAQGLAGMHPALRRRVLAQFLHASGFSVTAENLRRIEELATDWHGQGGVAVGGNSLGRLEVVRKAGKICIEYKEKGR